VWVSDDGATAGMDSKVVVGGLHGVWMTRPRERIVGDSTGKAVHWRPWGRAGFVDDPDATEAEAGSLCLQNAHRTVPPKSDDQSWRPLRWRVVHFQPSVDFADLVHHPKSNRVRQVE
jgi:hypothetical protein